MIMRREKVKKLGGKSAPVPLCPPHEVIQD
jgi:hypothetical protein